MHHPYVDLSISPIQYLLTVGMRMTLLVMETWIPTDSAGAYNAPLSEKVHLVINVGGVNGIDHFDQIDSNNSTNVYAGTELRAQIHPNVEFDLGYTWKDGEVDATNLYNLGILFALSKSIALSLGVVFLDEDADQGYGGLRFSF